jgi:hypothetical protein
VIEQVTAVIPHPLSVVESNVWDVTTWGTFLGDVQWIERSGHERYVFGIRHGRRVHEVPVAVRWYPQDHRVSWQELSGPPWRGELRLTAVNGRRTRLAIEVTAHRRTAVGSPARRRAPQAGRALRPHRTGRTPGPDPAAAQPGPAGGGAAADRPGDAVGGQLGGVPGPRGGAGAGARHGRRHGLSARPQAHRRRPPVSR